MERRNSISATAENILSLFKACFMLEQNRPILVLLHAWSGHLSQFSPVVYLVAPEVSHWLQSESPVFQGSPDVQQDKDLVLE